MVKFPSIYPPPEKKLSKPLSYMRLMDRFSKTKIEESLDGLELGVVATGLSSQKLIALFEDLDARMDGNLSGALNIRNDSLNGWILQWCTALDSSDSAKLFLNTQGMLTEGLESGSSEYKNMYLLERALKILTSMQ